VEYHFFSNLYSSSFLSYHCEIEDFLSQPLPWEAIMNGQIFYRQRQKVKEGSKTPRFRIAAISGLDLKVYADHLRLKDLKQIADATGADLVELTGGGRGGGGKSRPATA
jgi:hypothetical protein